MIRCPKCGRKHEDSVVTCDCGHVLKSEDGIKESSSILLSGYSSSKYPVLETISGIYKFLAWIVGIGAIIGIIFGITLLDNYGGKAAGTSLIIYSLIAGFFGVITLLAISEVIKLFIDIEYNTRNKKNSIG